MLQMTTHHPCMLLMQDMKHSVCNEETHDWQRQLGFYAIHANCKSCWQCHSASLSVKNHLYKCIWLCSNVADATASVQPPTTGYGNGVSKASPAASQ